MARSYRISQPNWKLTVYFSKKKNSKLAEITDTQAYIRPPTRIISKFMYIESEDRDGV